MAAWTTASISPRGRPGGTGSPKRKVTIPGRLTKRWRGQSRPLSTATGTTGSRRAVEAGKAGLERRLLARGHARAFGIEGDRPAFGDRRLGRAHHAAQRRAPPARSTGMTP